MRLELKSAEEISEGFKHFLVMAHPLGLKIRIPYRQARTLWLPLPVLDERYES